MSENEQGQESKPAEAKRLSVVELVAMQSVQARLTQASQALAQARAAHTAAQSQYAEVMIGVGLNPGKTYTIKPDGAVDEVQPAGSQRRVVRGEHARGSEGEPVPVAPAQNGRYMGEPSAGGGGV